MALLKAITNKKGITTNYHKVGDVSLVKLVSDGNSEDETYLICTNVKSFVSEDYRRISEGNTVSSKDYHFKVTLAEIAETPILELAYAKLKDMPEFEGAEDC